MPGESLTLLSCPAVPPLSSRPAASRGAARAHPLPRGRLRGGDRGGPVGDAALAQVSRPAGATACPPRACCCAPQPARPACPAAGSQLLLLCCHREWAEHDVMVMTPQILLNLLQHAVVRVRPGRRAAGLRCPPLFPAGLLCRVLCCWLGKCWTFQKCLTTPSPQCLPRLPTAAVPSAPAGV